MYNDILNVVCLLANENDCSMSLIRDVLLNDNVKNEIKKAIEEKKNLLKNDKNVSLT